MLEQSILGKLYHLWICSWAFSLLQRAYRAVSRAAQHSAILGWLFQEGWLEQAFRGSVVLRLVRGISGWISRLLGRCDRLGLYQATQDSVILRTVRGSVLRCFGSFEGLFCLFLFVMFVVPHELWNNLYAVAAAFGFLIVYLFLAGAGHRKWVSPELFGLGGLLFLLSLVLSLGFSAALSDSIRIFLFFLASLSFCYIIAANFRETEKLRRLLGYLYAALLVVSLYAIAQNALGLIRENSSFTDLSINKGVPGRVYSTLDNPINLSEFILIFLPLSAAFTATVRRLWLRIPLTLGLALPAVALVLTYSRGGWIAILLAALVYTFFRCKRLLPVLVVLGICCIPLLPESIMIRLATLAGGSKDSSTLHRLDIWRGVADLLAHRGRFLTGIGLGPRTFSIVYPAYAVGTAKAGAYHSQMHYLELDLELGLLGLFSFFYMMLKYLGRAGKVIRSGSRERRLILIACVSSIVALAFAGLVEYIWFYQRIMFAFFIFLGILLAAAAPAEAEAPTDSL